MITKKYVYFILTLFTACLSLVGCKDDDVEQAMIDVFTSFICDEISDFNSNVYYSNPDYIRCSYLDGRLLA